jgi:hypothetical protein
MRKLILLLNIIIALTAFAQNKDEITVLANTRSLHHAVFSAKDSAMLEKLFAKEVSYGHSGGKVENREEAIRGITQNKSTYADLAMGGITIQLNGSAAVTRHTMTADEVTADGATKPLKLLIMLVWIKEKNEWKLMSRQAVKI